MSTNAIIKVEGVQYAMVYKHWDGYPDATLPWLQDFNTRFFTKRGDDPEYKFAQLLRDSAMSAEQYDLDPSTETGWGVFSYGEPPVGAEYEYILKRDGSVVVVQKPSRL